MRHDGFRADADELDAHAAFLDAAVARPLGEAAAAGHPLDHLAYGLVGQVFAMATTHAVRTGSEVLHGLAARGGSFRDGVRDAAAAYRAVEDAAAGWFGPGSGAPDLTTPDGTGTGGTGTGVIAGEGP